MPDTPAPPQKPIRSGRWALIVTVSLVGLFVALDLMTSIHTTAPPRQGAKQPTGAASYAALQSFDTQTKQMEQDLERRKAALEATIEKARGVDLSGIRLPECNAAMREKLAGHFFSTATAAGEPLRLSCEPGDQWAVIPAAADSILPATPQQNAAMGQAPESNARAERERRKQEAARRRQEALSSSSVAVDFASAKLTSSASGVPKLTVNSEAIPETSNEAEAPPKKPDACPSTGARHKVFEGYPIEAVLVNRLNGEFTGPLSVQVSGDVYTLDRQHVLMPKGTRILGEAVKVSVQQQRRLAVVFHRAIMPDGCSIQFDTFTGLGQQGATGLSGRTNTHWLKVISTAVLVGAIGGLSEATSFGGSGGVAVIGTGVGSQSGQQATQILDRALNVLPSVTVYEGTRVRIWVKSDLDLPEYENHRMSPGI